MKPGTVVKIAVLILGVVVASLLLGLVCEQVNRRYEVLFSPGPALLRLAGYVLGAIALVVIAASLMAALVRPFWLIVLASAFSAAGVVIGWRAGIISAAAAVVYAALLVAFAHAVIRELDARVEFSVKPVRDGQGILLAALALLVSISLAAGYWDDARRRGFVLPPAWRQTVLAAMLPRLEAAIEQRGEVSPEFRAAIVAEVRQRFESLWQNLETTLQPYARFAPIALAALSFWMLKTVLGFLAWIPPLILSGIFPMLTYLRLTETVAETREVRRLVLR